MRSKIARLFALLLCLQLSDAYANELGDSGFGEFGKPGFMNIASASAGPRLDFSHATNSQYLGMPL